MMEYTFLIIGGMVSKLMPSAPRYSCRKRVLAVSTGRTQVGSAKLRSGNHRAPPVARDGTGTLVIPRIPKNMDMKNSP